LSDPLQLPVQRLLAFALLTLFLGQPLLFLFQPAAVVPLKRYALAAVQFQNPAGNIIKEVTVVGYGNYGTFITV